MYSFRRGPAAPALTDDMYTAAPRSDTDAWREGGRTAADLQPFHTPAPSSYIVSANDGDEMRQFFG